MYSTRRRMADPSRVTTGAITLRDLVAWAYRVGASQVSRPRWMDSAWFEINATLSADAPKTAVPEMLKNPRFQLVARTENRAQPVFVLTAPEGDNKLTRTADVNSESACLPEMTPTTSMVDRRTTRVCWNVSLQGIC